MLFKLGVVLFAIFAASHAGTCPDEKFSRIPGHTACLDASPDASDVGVSEADKKVIVDEHNTIRRNVKEPAANMLKMSWDDELQMIAQKWASTCNDGHDDNFKRLSVGRYSAGQNAATGYGDWKAAVLGWGSEIVNFTYGQPSTKKYGHYTQQIWATSYKIGCGYAKCGPTPNYVCNYGPAGNVGSALERVQPYKLGSSCGDCKTCDDRLCDCPGTECMNYGVLNVNKCDCTCPSSFYGGLLPYYKEGNCALQCDSFSKDEEYCGPFFPKEYCETMGNVPFHCPKMCGICPA